MPKQTFFNLSEHKIRTLIEAAEKEFTRVPLFEASIANIIKMAGIPRGSFYQYFEDKEDLYFYLLDEKLKESKNLFLTLLTKHNGDPIRTMEELYHHFLLILPDEEERSFLKNALLYTTNKVENSFTNMIDATHGNKHIKEFIELIDKEQLNIKDENDLLHIFKIIMAIAFHNFIEKIVKGLTDDEAMKNFKICMNLIKHGIYK
ncbi:TetR family transcriptional regulator [Robertmurraya massiliosenegalensis]|uniref:TetR/AcrR family transcriptional regulator n=1 Tax=Robertmurraya TaxID=2837507 RepID=UPI0039A4B476